MSENLRIGIDGYNLAMPHGTGVATYGASLATTLNMMGHRIEGVFGLSVGSTPELREVLFFDLLQRPATKKRPARAADAARRGRMLVGGARAVDVPLTSMVEKSAFADRLPAFDRIVSSPRLFELAHSYFQIFGRFVPVHMSNPPDIMHWTYPVPLRLVGARNIYTLHDLVPLRLPYTTLDFKRSYHLLVKQCVRNADHICTVSEASRADILARYDLPGDRLTNTYQASPLPTGMTAGEDGADAAMLEGIFGLRRQGYFLFFGAIEPKKNVGRLIEAYLALQSDTPLVIVGARAWQSEQELKLLPGGDNADGVFGRRLGERVIRLDYLPRTLLMRLIRNARAVTFPSLYEGFGLPVLEALQLGTPVLASNTSSLPEVAGDAAILVNPYSVEQITDGLRALDQDAELRATLSARGRVQAAKFSTERYAERLDAMLRTVATAPPRRG